MSNPPEEDRIPDLAEAVNDIDEYITSRLTVYREATGREVEHYLIVIDGSYVEESGAISDFDRMADAFGNSVTRWAEEGKTLFEDEDEGPLFTATFDIEKVRPS